MILAYITAYKQEEIRGCPNYYCVEKGMKRKDDEMTRQRQMLEMLARPNNNVDLALHGVGRIILNHLPVAPRS